MLECQTANSPARDEILKMSPLLASSSLYSFPFNINCMQPVKGKRIFMSYFAEMVKFSNAEIKGQGYFLLD